MSSAFPFWLNKYLSNSPSLGDILATLPNSIPLGVPRLICAITSLVVFSNGSFTTLFGGSASRLTTTLCNEVIALLSSAISGCKLLKIDSREPISSSTTATSFFKSDMSSNRFVFNPVLLSREPEYSLAPKLANLFVTHTPCLALKPPTPSPFQTPC